MSGCPLWNGCKSERISLSSEFIFSLQRICLSTVIIFQLFCSYSSESTWNTSFHNCDKQSKIGVSTKFLQMNLKLFFFPKKVGFIVFDVEEK
jgi:hypothetical protein